MSVFVDTSALYAILVRTEEGHEAAVAAFERLLAAGRPLATTNYVLLETTALLQRPSGCPPCAIWRPAWSRCSQSTGWTRPSTAAPWNGCSGATAAS